MLLASGLELARAASSRLPSPPHGMLVTNSKIATVNSSGKITAKGKGTCYIYAFAHNGVSKQIKV